MPQPKNGKRPNLPYDEQTVVELRELVADCPTWLEARDVLEKRLQTHPDNITRMNRRHQFWTPPTGTQDAAVVGTSHSNAGGEFNVEVQTSVPKTLDEVVKLVGVDLDQWESKGFLVRRGAKGFAWSAQFRKKDVPVNVDHMIVRFTDAIAKHVPVKWVCKPVNTQERDCMYVLNAHDLHLAKLAFPAETGGAPWDIKIAERMYREALSELIKKAPVNRIEEVVIIVGSDLLQVDNDKSSTAAGTYVDSDTRLAKVFDVATKMLADEIEKLATVFRVRAVVIPGNHDLTVSYFVGKYLEAFFRTHPNVIVDSGPKSRKYVAYGKNLIGFDHGDETRLADLPLLLMRENQETISQFKYQEVLTGHLHRESVDEYKGIKVRVAPALCSADRWHARKGLVGSLRQCQGLLYQRERGLEAIYYTTPLD